MKKPRKWLRFVHLFLYHEFTFSIGSRPSDHYFHSVCLSVCAEFFSAVFDPISIKLGHVICLGLVVSPRI